MKLMDITLIFDKIKIILKEILRVSRSLLHSFYIISRPKYSNCHKFYININLTIRKEIFLFRKSMISHIFFPEQK